jgi:hypothetical protein
MSPFAASVKLASETIYGCEGFRRPASVSNPRKPS